MSKITFNVRDYSDEYSPFSLHIPDVDEVSWLATNTAITTIQTALAALTVGNIANKVLTAYNTTVNDARPANAFAQRETGLRLFYQDDNTGKKYYVTVPAPDLALVAEGGKDDVDMTLSIISTLTAAIEAVAVSEEGNPITFYRGTIVGRKS